MSEPHVLELHLLLLLRYQTALLERVEVTAALEASRGDEALDLGTKRLLRQLPVAFIRVGGHSRLSVRLRVLLLRALNLAADNILPHVVLLGQVEEPADLRRALRSEPLGNNGVRQAGDVAIALLDDHAGEDGDVRANDAAAHGLSLALTCAARAVARVSVGEEEADTVREENTLLHREALLIVSTGDAEDVALPFVAERVGGNLGRHLLVIEDAAGQYGQSVSGQPVKGNEMNNALSPLLIEVDGLLRASGGVWRARDARVTSDPTMDVRRHLLAMLIFILGGECTATPDYSVGRCRRERERPSLATVGVASVLGIGRERWGSAQRPGKCRRAPIQLVSHGLMSPLVTRGFVCSLSLRPKASCKILLKISSPSICMISTLSAALLY